MNPIQLARLGSFMQKAWPYLVGALLIGAILALTYCAGGKDKIIEQKDAEIELRKDVGDANDKAGELRVEDKARIMKQQEELEDAIDNATSDDDARRRAGCTILRQQGHDVSGLAACAGS